MMILNISELIILILSITLPVILGKNLINKSRINIYKLPNQISKWKLMFTVTISIITPCFVLLLLKSFITTNLIIYIGMISSFVIYVIYNINKMQIGYIYNRKLHVHSNELGVGFYNKEIYFINTPKPEHKNIRCKYLKNQKTIPDTNKYFVLDSKHFQQNTTDENRYIVFEILEKFTDNEKRKDKTTEIKK